MLRQRNFEIVQKLEFLTEEQIINAINETDENGINHLINYAYILHDKDNKDSHWHIDIKMDNAYSFETIAKRFKVPTQNVEKIKTTFAQALNYLTHNTEDAKNKKKYLYNDDEVKSNYEWKEERQKAINKEHRKNRKNEIVNLIGNGTIRKFNYYEYITIEEYNTYKKDIDNAFNYREDKVKGVNRNMECMFISGNAGSGKTTYAKRYADSKGYSAYISSGSNDVLDDYRGQDCLILDDLRPSCMGLSDLLKMLDNHTNSTVKSRYKNKSLQECRLIIITSVLSLEDFFKNVFSEQTEPIKQLQRRCTTKIRMDNQFLYISFYDEEKENYTKEKKLKNPYVNIYERVTYKTDEEIINRAKDFFIDGIDFVEEDKEEEIEEYKDNKTKEIKKQEVKYISDNEIILSKGLNSRTGKLEKYIIDRSGNEIKIHEDKRTGKYFYYEKRNNNSCII